MKRLSLLLGALIIVSATAFAWGGYGHGNSSGCMGNGFFNRMGYGWHHMRGREYNYREATPEDQREYLEVRERNIEIYNKYGVKISKKQLKIERELLKDKPDWEKISMLNEDIAKLEAAARTEQMKNNYRY